MSTRLSCALVWCAGVSACTIDDIDPTNKACSLDKPCPDSWTCVGGSCQRAPGTVIGDCIPGSAAADFRAAWTTPNSIRWTWTPIGGAAFDEYRIVLARDPSDLAALRDRAVLPQEQGDGQIWTHHQNAELRHYDLPNSKEIDVVDATITDGLLPRTRYHAELVVLGNACAFVSPTTSATTGEPLTARTIFDDGADAGAPLSTSIDARPDEGGTSQPAEIQSIGAAHRGVEYVSWPGLIPGADVKWENVGVKDLMIPGPSLKGVVNDYGRAYVELAASSSVAREIARYSEIHIGLCSPALEIWTARNLVLRGGGAYHVYQIPLSAFASEGQPLTPEILIGADTELCEIRVGQTFQPGESVRFDSVTLVY